MSKEAVLKVAIVGGGLGGVAVAIRLLELGIRDFVLLEKGSSLGGAWRENTYPGCACDVPSQLYSYSFAPNPEWQHVYARQEEIRAYVERTATDRGVMPHARLGVALLRADWDPKDSLWVLKTSAGVLRAQMVVAATGPLHEPAYPNVPGLESFAGPCFHSARWDHRVSLEGKRVAVIGTGASAIQFVPAIQRRVAQLTVFQRTAPWVLPKFDVPISPTLRRAYRAFPALQRVSREATACILETIGIAQRDHRAMRVLSAFAALNLRQVRDAGLRERLTPAYAIGCKRILLSNEWYSTLQAPNCTVVDGSPQRVEGNLLIDATGRAHEADVILLGTGFMVTNNPAYDLFHDERGTSLSAAWRGSPHAYLGTSVVGFPNLFLVAGPNTANGHTSLLLAIEAQADYIAQAARRLAESGRAQMVVRETVESLWNADIQSALGSSVWNAGGCSSYYLDSTGANRAIFPWSPARLEDRLRTFDPADYDIAETPRPEAESITCVALVTGAASGIGQALCRALLDRGAHVVATDIDGESLRRRFEHTGATTYALDVRDAPAFARLADDVRARFGRIDMLFNNAGVSVAGEARDFALVDWTRVFDVNVMGVVHGIQAVYPDMLRRRRGHIINVSSAAGLVPMPMMASYTASKHAVVGLTAAIRAEAHDLGVRVSVACPGVVDTQIQTTTRIVGYDPAIAVQGHAARGISAEECAAEILRGVDRNEGVIVITPLAKSLHVAQRLLPGLVERVTRSQLRELRRYRRPEANAGGAT